MKFHIETLGCKVNMYESNYIRECLLTKGYEDCNNIKDSDIVILNTCSVTNTSDSKSLKLARHIRRENNNCIFVICGCSTQNNKDIFNDINVDILIGTKDKTRIPFLIDEYVKTNNKYINICNVNNLEFENMEINDFDQIRAYVKIQDGCNNYCSYCIIPYVRGNIRFKEFSDVINEVSNLASNGYKEIVLTGIHTGSYPKLYKLIDELSKITGIKRIRLSSIEITELDSEFLELLKNNKVLCNHLHIPLQAGSDVILKRMNRKYDTKYYYEKIKSIRSINKDINISTDVIVGHPYETDELFEETFEFCKKIKFSKIHVFSYSDREGTASSKMDEHVNPKDIKIRSKKLLGLSDSLEKEYYKKFVGNTLEVLVDEVKEDYSVGHTTNFLKIKLDKSCKLNEFYDIIIKDKEEK